MGKSYRKPFSACCGNASAKKDKRQAARAVRRTQDRWLRNLEDFDSALVPHRLECPHNEVYGWVRDGKQRYRYPSAYDRLDYDRYRLGLWDSEGERRALEKYDSVWPPQWYQRLCRK